MEEQIRNKKTLPIVVMICVTIMVIAIGSYALWQMTKKQSGRNVVGTTCLSIDIEDESGDISLQNSWPISDADGSNTNPYTFTVTNNCDQDVNYIVALESLPAGNNESSSYLDYDYIRLQLDNDSPLTYGSLEGITNDNGVRDTKEITHHTLGAGESVEHSLRIWVKEDTPLQNEDESYNTEKYFYGKVKVLAGQGIQGDSTTTVNENLKVLSASGEPIARLNNISVGDRLGYEGEEFYVVGIDGNNVKLLSRYLLNVGWNPNPYQTQGLQNVELGYTRADVTDLNSATEYGEEVEGEDLCWCGNVPDEDDETGVCLGEETCEPEIWFKRYGVVPFSNNNYWYDNGWISPYTANSFVYNENASISTYVNGYVQILQTMGLNVTNGTLLSLEEVSTLCNTTITSYGNYSSQCPSYLFETSYWLGSAYSFNRAWRVSADGYLGNYYNYRGDSVGVRPVITVTLN